MDGSDLISRSALETKAKIIYMEHGNVAVPTRVIPLSDLYLAPAIDAEPVRHGQLVSTGTDELYCEWGDCTVCGSDNRINAKFCNNCGAKIEGVVRT